MARIKRVDVGGEIYHILNRTNARVQIFDTDADYMQFEAILEEAVEKFGMRILAYCIMPNHWHLVLYPQHDGDLQAFMGWLTNTHTRRWHVTKATVGQGHLYQGRYKSFLCERDKHLFTILRYVERNAKKADIVKIAEQWKWSSVWRREYGTEKQKKILSIWPMTVPKNYLEILNTPLTKNEEDVIERSETKNIPYGSEVWVDSIITHHGIEQVLRQVGRPKNGG